MAARVVAAVASGDYAELDALQSDATRKELGDINRTIFGKLRKTLDAEGIDLTKAKIVGVEPTDGIGVQMVDVFIQYEARVFRTHFSAITIGGEYQFTSLAQWIKWVDQDD